MQYKRLRSDNFFQFDYYMNELLTVVRHQIKKGKYKSSDIYGDGDSATKIVEILKSIDLKAQKTINY
jgi:hypothetical protein